jgi:hypothetical protein
VDEFYGERDGKGALKTHIVLVYPAFIGENDQVVRTSGDNDLPLNVMLLGSVLLAQGYTVEVKALVGSDQANRLKRYNKAIKSRVILALRTAFLTLKIGV